MPKYLQDNEQISDGVNLLISILVRYPEIGTINFDPSNNSIKLTFMLSGIPTKQDFIVIKHLILDSITAFHMLEGCTVEMANVEFGTYDQVTMLHMVRDVHTLSKGEIALVIMLLRDRFKDRLVIDYNDSMQEEDLLIQEELIEDMLENMKKQYTGNSLIGIREDGRVLVFNK